MSTGIVSLVGAGPADPDLLTVRAFRRIEAAELVLYDGLVDPRVVAVATRAQRFSVSKRAKRPTVGQQTINRLMIRAARRGKRVVRLKSGDPFVLGRGGEEALALSAAGVPFEVIPGLSSAVAAPTLAGIPVTHRGLASGFAVVSGHAESVFGPLLDELVPNGLTLVILMGLASRARIASRLVDRGWHPNTPVAVVMAAGTPDMATWVGRLEHLSEAVLGTPTGSPGTIVVGEVVRLCTSIGGRLLDVSPADPVAQRSEAREYDEVSS